MSDPFSPNSKSQLVREARFGLSLVAVLLILFLYVAYYRITGQGREIPEHVRRAPVSQPIWPYEKEGAPEHFHDSTPSASFADVGQRSHDTQSSRVNSTNSKRATNHLFAAKTSPDRKTRQLDQRKRAPVPDLEIFDPQSGSQSGEIANGLKKTNATPPNRSRVAASNTPVHSRTSQQHLVDENFPANVADDPFQAMLRNKDEKSIDVRSAGLQTESNRDVATQASAFDFEPSFESEPAEPKKNRGQAKNVGESNARMTSPINVNGLRKTPRLDNAARFAPANRLPSKVQQEPQRHTRRDRLEDRNGFQPMSLPNPANESQEFRPSQKSFDATAPRSGEFEDSSRGAKWDSPPMNDHPGERNDLGDQEFTPQFSNAKPGVSFASKQMVLPDRPPIQYDANSRSDERPGPDDDSAEGRDTKSNSTNALEGFSGGYVVKPGDSFWTISESAYGDGRYFRALYRYNQAVVSNSDELVAGTRVATPAPEELAKLWPQFCPRDALNFVETDGGSNRYPIYRTQEGDTLFGIATDQLDQASRWVEILELNYSRLNSNVNHLTSLPAHLDLFLPRE